MIKTLSQKCPICKSEKTFLKRIKDIQWSDDSLKNYKGEITHVFECTCGARFGGHKIGDYKIK